MTAPLTRLDKALAALPGRYAGPGGAVAVLRDGETLIRHAWGWADVECRRPFTPETMALVCSITKQFTCALLLDQFPDPTALDGDLADFMPALQQPSPGILDLCHNQSGLRDYWATAMLCGAPVEGYFGAGGCAPPDRPHPHAAFPARHALFLRQPEFPPARRHHRAPHRPELRHPAAQPHPRSRRHAPCPPQSGHLPGRRRHHRL